MRKSLAQNLRTKKQTRVTWNTLAGNVSTANVAKVQFLLPEFYKDRVIKYNVHLTETLKTTT